MVPAYKNISPVFLLPLFLLRHPTRKRALCGLTRRVDIPQTPVVLGHAPPRVVCPLGLGDLTLNIELMSVGRFPRQIHISKVKGMLRAPFETPSRRWRGVNRLRQA